MQSPGNNVFVTGRAGPTGRFPTWKRLPEGRAKRQNHGRRRTAFYCDNFDEPREPRVPEPVAGYCR